MWLVTAIVIGALVSEDLAAVSAGLLAADGRLSIWVAMAAAAAGIWFGDLAVYAAGWLAGPSLDRPWLKRRLAAYDLAEVRRRYDRHAGKALLATRFVPGTRFAMYVTAGALRIDWRRFLFWTLVAVLAWVPLIVGLVAWLGEAAAAPIRTYVGQAWVLLPIALLLGWKIARTRSASKRARTALATRWEFWPPWLFYAPVVPWVIWLLVRHGIRSLPAANPGIEDGGFVGESKADILARLPEPWVLPWSRIPAGEPEARCAAVDALMTDTAWQFPVILKPDVGQRGAGVRLVADRAGVRAYFEAVQGPVVVQAYHPGPFEAGVFYYRRPGESRGQIFSLTDKHFPVIAGDGRSTVEELIRQHPRYSRQAHVFLPRHQARLGDVLSPGDTLRLAVAGNHAQGTLFRDGRHLITTALLDRVDAIARQIDGFHIGRFDVRYSSVDEFRAGRDFAIVELNGVTSEATHIYDPSGTIWSAYTALYAQWRLVFEIGAANRKRGVRVSPVGRLLRRAWDHLRSREPVLLSD